MEKKYYNIEQIFHNIYNRLSCNDWIIQITFGDLDNRLELFEKIFKSSGYDHSLDELWIENIPKLDPVLSEVSPIIVACMKRDSDKDYGTYTIKTPLDERKDCEILVLGTEEDKKDDLKNLLLINKIKKDWFVRRLQFYIDKKNGINSDMQHPSLSRITSFDPEARNYILSETVRLDSVLVLGIVEKEFRELPHVKIHNNHMYVDEDAEISKYAIDKFLKILEISINLDSQNFVSWHLKGYFLYKDGNYEDAEKCFRSAHNINPKWTDSIFYEGKMMVLQGFPQSGLELINKAIIQEPVRANYRVFKANVLQNIGQYLEASTEYGEAKIQYQKLDTPIVYIQFILVSEYFCLQKIKQFEKAKKVLESLKETMVNGKLATSLFDDMYNSKNITNQLIDKVEKDLDIKAFTLTEDVKENIKKITDIFKNLNEFLWWKDQYWSKKAFDWIKEACLTNDSIKDIRILTSIQKENEYVNRPFKKKIDQIQKFLKERNVKFELRIVTDDKVNRRLHGRLIISKNIILSVPSVNNFFSGSDDVVSPVDVPIEDTHFDEWWKQSVNFYEFYDKNGTFQSTKNA